MKGEMVNGMISKDRETAVRGESGLWSGKGNGRDDRVKYLEKKSLVWKEKEENEEKREFKQPV